MAYALDVWVSIALTAVLVNLWRDLGLSKLVAFMPELVLLMIIPMIPWLYFTFFQSAGRSTLGQVVCGTAALHADGRPLSVREAAERAVLQALYWGFLFPPLLGPRFDWSTKREQGEYLR